jgi:uncharacterized membrane protein YkvA (DUF1232 family)
MFEMNWRNQAQRVQREAQVYYFAFKHPRVHWCARLVAACTASYLLSPVQLIPSFIPVVGLLDDFLVLVVAAKLLQRIIPSEVLAECRKRADAEEMRRKEEIISTSRRVAFVVIAAVWLFVAIGAAMMMSVYITH